MNLILFTLTLQTFLKTFLTLESKQTKGHNPQRLATLRRKASKRKPSAAERPC